MCTSLFLFLLIGYGVGFLFCLLKDTVPLYFRLNILITPKLLYNSFLNREKLDNKIYKGFFTLNNQNYSGGRTSSGIISSEDSNSNSYSAFSGKGQSWGNSIPPNNQQ